MNTMPSKFNPARNSCRLPMHTRIAQIEGTFEEARQEVKLSKWNLRKGVKVDHVLTGILSSNV